jgi:hypothetical protein
MTSYGEGDEGEVVVAALFVAGDAAELLEPIDEPLDALAGAVRCAI